jgi:hypothetical protein
MEEKVFPPGAEPAAADEAAQAQAAADAAAAADKAAAEAAEAAKSDDAAKAAEAEAAAKAAEDAEAGKDIKKRSIYDDYKDKKQEAKESADLAAAEKARADAAEAKAADLQALLDAKADAKTPEEKSEADDDLKSFAEAEGMTVDSLQRLIGVIEKKLSRPALPEEISKEIAELRSKVETREQADRRAAEDNAIREQSPAIKEQLKALGSEVHNESEFSAVMNEVLKLSHTTEFHDKPIEYILWAKRADLGKMISPKKPSFEGSSGNQSEGSAPTVDFSTGRVTPEQAQKAQEHPRATYEISHAK